MQAKEEVLVLKEKWHKEYAEDAVIVGDEEDKTLDEVVESFNKGKIIYSNMSYRGKR